VADQFAKFYEEWIDHWPFCVAWILSVSNDETRPTGDRQWRHEHLDGMSAAQLTQITDKTHEQ
jgi:hypothetical protein